MPSPVNKGSKRPTLIAPVASTAAAGPFGERGAPGEGSGPFLGDLPPSPSGASAPRGASGGPQARRLRRASTGAVPSEPLLSAGKLGSTTAGHHSVFDFGEFCAGSPGGSSRPGSHPTGSPTGRSHVGSHSVPAPRDVSRRMSLPGLGGSGAGAQLSVVTPSLGQLPAARLGARRTLVASASAPDAAPLRPPPAAADEPLAVASPAAEPREPAGTAAGKRHPTQRRRSSEPVAQVSSLWQKASKGVVEEVRNASKVRRDEAAEVLQEALAGKEQSQVIDAIGRAKTAGLDKKTISEATKVLQRIMATDALEEAKRIRNADKMRHALSRAKAAGVTSKQLEEYNEFLKQLDMETLLVVATHRAESGALKIAIGAARGGGVECEALEVAEKKLAELEAIRGLQAALKGGQAHRIREALDRLPDTCVEAAEEARRILAGLEADGNDEGDGSRPACRSPTGTSRNRTLTRNLTRGFLLDEQPDPEPMDEVEERLRRAIHFKETGALKLALQAAKAYGTRYAAAIAEAERVLAQVEAVWQLNAAVKKGDAGKLKEVMERAVAAGVEEHFLGPARLLLEQADARTALSNAIKSKDPAELEAAMVAARSCGVDRARIARAEQTLMQLSSTKETASGNLRRTDTGLNNRTTDTQIIRQAVVAGSRR